MCNTEEGISTSRSQFWVFTYFPDDKPWPSVLDDTMNYLVWQEELSPQTQRLHVQGYVEFKNRVRLGNSKGGLKKLYPTAAWFMRRGTALQASDYCKKVDTRAVGGRSYEAGEIRGKGRGERTDLSDAVVILKERGLKAVAEDAPEVFVKYHNGFRALSQLTAAERPAGVRTVYVLYGPPGTGKSFYARQLAEGVGNGRFCVPAVNNSNKLSFENYQNESTIILDDFHPVQFSSQNLKTMTDRYQNVLVGRGVSPNNNADQIVVTSNSEPQFWWKDDPTFWGALVRRSTFIIHCGQNVWSAVVDHGVEVVPDPFSVGVPYPKPVIPSEPAGVAQAET